MKKYILLSFILISNLEFQIYNFNTFVKRQIEYNTASTTAILTLASHIMHLEENRHK